MRTLGAGSMRQKVARGRGLGLGGLGDDTKALMAFPFFTLGHSTLGAFIDLLTASKVGLVVDVRAIPRSSAQIIVGISNRI